MYVVMLALAVKGGWDLIDFFRKKYQEKFNKDYKEKKKEEALANHYLSCQQQHDEFMQKYDSLEGKIDDLTSTVNDKFDSLEKRVNLLTESDMHDIKQAIVKDYHYFVEDREWIDDFSLDCLERRFDDYKKENGNSYIAGLMSEIRQLPKHPPL
jgi:hypothetical protein